jgi:hypothetical protein
MENFGEDSAIVVAVAVGTEVTAATVVVGVVAAIVEAADDVVATETKESGFLSPSLGAW